MKLRVISPQKRIYSSENVVEAYIPTKSGIVGILVGHEDLISLLNIGEVRVKNKDSSEFEHILVSGGILEVKDNDIIILADEADLPHEVIKEETEKAIKMAEEKISSEPLSTELILLEKQLIYQKFKKEKARI